MTQEKKTYPCFVCRANGFPDEQIILAGRDDAGKSIRQNLDGSDHIHKNKFGKKPYVQTTSTMNQYQQQPPTNNNKTASDERIESMHKENVEDRAEYRKIMKEQVDATRALADAILELARAMKGIEVQKDGFRP